MVIMALAWAARRRVAVLVMALSAVVVLQVLRRVVESELADLLALGGLLLPFALMTWSAAAGRAFHPAKLVARPTVPALDVPANPGVILGAVGYTLLGSRALDMLADRLTAGANPWFPACVTLIWAGLLAACWRTALGRTGVRLRPDGILDRRMFGSRFIPWAALAGPYPARTRDAQQVTLVLARPELVHGRGLRFGDPASLRADSIDAELLARAIHEYVSRPDLRPAIGSTAELARLEAIPQISALAKRP